MLSSDYRFGDGDLGPRGMALFFHTFRHSTVASALGIPFFPLSKTELDHQSKYEGDSFSFCGNNDSLGETSKDLNRFEAMDQNRNRRKSFFAMPSKESVPDHMKETEKRSNMAESMKVGQEKNNSLMKSFKQQLSLRRTKSEVDEVQVCLDLAREDFQFDKRLFFRKDSGELMAKVNETSKMPKRSSLIIRRVSDPMIISDSTRRNLGLVHYQLAVLHGMGRFSEEVSSDQTEDVLSHDVFSVLFHLSHAASLRCVPACLALGRVLAGLGTCVSDLLDSLVPVDFEGAKCLLKRAMESAYPPNAPKLAAGCLLYQIYRDEALMAQEGIQNDGTDSEVNQPPQKQTIVSDLMLINLLEEIFDLMLACDEERKTNLQFKERSKKSSLSFHVGDKVEGNYFLEGNYYPGVVESISNDGAVINVKYDDDGTVESLPSNNVRMLVPPTATQTDLGGPLTDEEAGFGGGGDEIITVESYQLRTDLAKLVENSGDKLKASNLYEEAAREAMEANKMKLATELSLKAADLAS